MSRQTHRTCIRMSEKGYQRLKHLSCAAGLSANAWLMKELERNRPILYRVERPGKSFASWTRRAGTSTPWPGTSTAAMAQRRNCGSLRNVWPRWWSGSAHLRKQGYPRAV
ncbi:MAG: hypothetical protein V8R75_14530 [Oscillospiraceae bacterium]